MASPRAGTVPAKLSFAKIAAMPAPNVAPAAGNAQSETKTRPAEQSHDRKPSQPTKPRSPVSLDKPTRPMAGLLTMPINPNTIVDGIEGLALVKARSDPASAAKSAESGESFEDDQSHLSNSSLKQQSFETKSMASVTTFAMDEKESIRPDDSASVRAVDDDEPHIVLSREPSFHHKGEQALEPMPRPIVKPTSISIPIASRRFPTLTLANAPRFGDLPVDSMFDTEDAQTDLISITQSHQDDQEHRTPVLLVAPDEKLLTALATLKERLPLLQLEEKVLSFIASPSEILLDLPPQNSFTRMLTHKLADYYGLPHHINDDNSSVRVFRGMNAELPTSLAVLAQAIPIGTVPPANGFTVKIMRRGGLRSRQFSAGGSTAESSLAPSKATSENGAETNSDEGIMSPYLDSLNRDKSKLTREEREAQYKAARDRIFGDFQESIPSEGGSTGETSANMSRSSSSSGKRKSRKNKTPNDDTFEARSAFIPSYGPMPMSAMQSHYLPSNVEASYQHPYATAAGNYQSPVNYGTTPTQSFPGFDANAAYGTSNWYGMASPQQYGNVDAWPNMQATQAGSHFGYPSASQGYQHPPPPASPHASSPFIPPQHASPMAPSQSSGGIQYQNPYQQTPTLANSTPSQWSGYAPTTNSRSTAPYQYGQLPSQNYGNNNAYNAQHPVPGSYSRSLFNPQTRSFVPSNASSRAGGRTGRKKNPSPSTPTKNGATIKPIELNGTTPSVRSGEFISSATPSPTLKEDSLQQKYGAPAHLPKKPPPSQIPSSYGVEGMSQVAVQQMSNGGLGPLVVNGSGGAERPR